MFILVSCWQHTKVKNKVEDRMSEAYAEAAVSVTITTLTDVLAFYIGIATSFPSVQSFCLYTGTAFIFCYIYNLTFLGAVLALNGRREESNRHWLTFRKVKQGPQDSQGCMYNWCCAGGSYDESTGTEPEHPMNELFRKHYGPFLMHKWTKVFVLVFYLMYLSSSIYGCTLVKEGINVRHLATDNSYVIQYYDWDDEYFSEYGPRIMVAVTESVAYWNSSVRQDLENCMVLLEDSLYVDKSLSMSWLRNYEAFAKRTSLNIDDRSVFLGNLATLFTANPESALDINFSDTEISTSRFFIQTINVSTAVDEKNLLNQLRGIVEDCNILMVYHPAFIFFDQFLVIVHNTVQNVVIATTVMLVISLLLIPNPLCSLWVTFAIASVIVGVTGFMAYWDINLDSISMINLVICIGFSVDYSAHISYAFVSSEKPKVNEKAVDALYRLGYPILQAAASTLVGVLVLSTSSTYIFRTFFKIITLVILFGAAHGLIFIPVLLTFFGFCGLLSNRRCQNSDQCFEKSPNIEGSQTNYP
uniref:Patched domain-containing protein 3 n=2 Tax=Varanus komodoensis TaxID=61221 RepID=A0A8D2LTI1_VARKO